MKMFLSKDVEFDYITVGRNIAQNIDLENFELHQESINSAFSDVDIEGKEIITVQLIEDILAEGDYVKQYGLESFYIKHNLSEFTIEQLLKITHEDISSLVNEEEFNNIPPNEKLMLLKAIEINKNFLDHSNPDFQAKDGEYMALYGCVGQFLGTIIAPGIGTAVGNLVGIAVGAILDEVK